MGLRPRRGRHAGRLVGSSSPEPRVLTCVPRPTSASLPAQSRGARWASIDERRPAHEDGDEDGPRLAGGASRRRALPSWPGSAVVPAPTGGSSSCGAPCCVCRWSCRWALSVFGGRCDTDVLSFFPASGDGESLVRPASASALVSVSQSLCPQRSPACFLFLLLENLGRTCVTALWGGTKARGACGLRSTPAPHRFTGRRAGGTL